MTLAAGDITKIVGGAWNSIFGAPWNFLNNTVNKTSETISNVSSNLTMPLLIIGLGALGFLLIFLMMSRR